MSSIQRVVWLDHQSASLLEVRGDGTGAIHLKAHHHHTRQHASEVRTEHEFFAAVCDAIANIAEALIVGSHTALDDFRHYVDKHRPAVRSRIAGWEISDRLSERQLAALGRRFFDKHDRMAGGAPGLRAQ